MSCVRLAALACVGTAVVVGCGSAPPMRYYTLSEVQPVAAPTGDAINPRLRLGPVTVPAELDRLELVTHSDANQVRIHESNRWAAPLDEQIRRTLSDDLAARLPPQTVADPNEPTTRDPRRVLSVAVTQLVVTQPMAGDACTVTLSVSWTLRTPGVPDRAGTEHVDAPATSACPAGAPAAISQALAALADRVVAMLQSS